MEPGLRPERLGCLRDVEPGEELQLHDAALPGIDKPLILLVA